ncbi:type II toxin-antitoxin system antitoxin [Streptomyces similanensis]|uniref:Toxin-antitoxin system HicB family antitoxin n=1 Tax=Streptomyces similanensis TaxID=1274988 RepID=A0ABP9L5E0_9ACTN
MTAPEEGTPARRRPQQRKQVLLRLDPSVYDALARWASDELRSANAQIEYLLRRALAEAGRLPGETGPLPRRGRPPRTPPPPGP